MTETLIKLESVSKTYPGTDIPAVKELDLEVLKGEILILVGPSGCGKSTTLRLINRMIEPTGGRIYFEGEDVTDVNPDLLRRRIGYVIQQIGLFPHRTIAENVGTVPNLLGWDKDKTNKRVDELLDTVGMDPSIYRDRYPKELSGGQAQRVGVARAMGADPDVLLMDEPFGAVDPITRDRLQNEFLRLQEELQKTIVFVTHDIDEAIKMGDRIAILQEQSVIAQHDTPERILAHPANQFVTDFLGSGAILKGLTLMRVRNIETSDVVTVTAPTSRDEVKRALDQTNDDWVLLLDDAGHPQRWLDRASLTSTGALEDTGRDLRVRVEPDDTLRDALEKMLTSSIGTACCVDPAGKYVGVIRLETLVNKIDELQRAERDRQQVVAAEARANQ
ncbi:MAG: betaine/proline/choline family ABC transporter ATP-binding protein [Acidimicrobiia bacterium]